MSSDTVSTESPQSGAALTLELEPQQSPPQRRLNFGGVSRLDVPKAPALLSEASSSVLQDRGDGHQLARQNRGCAEPPLGNAEGRSAVLLHVGGQFPFKTTECYAAALAANASPVPDAPDDKPLEDELWKARVRSTSGRREHFLPMSKLDELITRESVRKELENCDAVSKEDLDCVTGQVWGITQRQHRAAGGQPGDTSRRKIFAILVLMKDIGRITELIKQNIFDCHLPLTDEPASDGKYGGMYYTGDDGKPVEVGGMWDDKSQDNWLKYQAWMTAPFFVFSCSGKKDGAAETKVWHQELNSHVLPFLDEKLPRSEENVVISGFSTVRQVQIHESHHNCSCGNNKGRSSLFAVKTLHVRNRELESRETKALKRFSNKDHDHLIRLLATFTHQEMYHLVFHWADGNLQDFWKNEAYSPQNLTRNEALAGWVSQQCCGLVHALDLIHHADPLSLNLQKASQHPEYKGKPFGRHGDLKPENILWFRGDGSKYGPHGILKISDFGMADFRAEGSAQHVPIRDFGITPTYRAPEYDIMYELSPAFDLWTLGCVLLEFVCWYLKGWDGVDMFARARTGESPQNQTTKRDTFFNFICKSKADGHEVICGQLKRTVAKEMNDLNHHAGGSDFILDLLHPIEDHLLRMKPSNRILCKEAVPIFERIRNNCRGNQNYCLKVTANTPRPVCTTLSEFEPYHHFSQEMKKRNSEDAHPIDGVLPPTSAREETNPRQRTAFHRASRTPTLPTIPQQSSSGINSLLASKAESLDLSTTGSRKAHEGTPRADNASETGPPLRRRKPDRASIPYEYTEAEDFEQSGDEDMNDVPGNNQRTPRPEPSTSAGREDGHHPMSLDPPHPLAAAGRSATVRTNMSEIELCNSSRRPSLCAQAAPPVPRRAPLEPMDQAAARVLSGTVEGWRHKVAVTADRGAGDGAASILGRRERPSADLEATDGGSGSPMLKKSRLTDPEPPRKAGTASA